MKRSTHPIFIAAFLANTLVGCISLPIQRVTDGEARAPTIYVIEHGWHTDIALPVDQLTGPSERLKQYFPDAKYLAIGFGDRHYMMTQRTTFDDVLAAIFPGPSALLITGLSVRPSDIFAAGTVAGFYVPDTGMAKIDDLLWRSFERDRMDQPMPLGDGADPDSVFYASTGTYDIFHTCNTWSAEILRQGGLAVSTNGVVFTSQVMTAVFAKRMP